MGPLFFVANLKYYNTVIVSPLVLLFNKLDIGCKSLQLPKMQRDRRGDRKCRLANSQEGVKTRHIFGCCFGQRFSQWGKIRASKQERKKIVNIDFSLQLIRALAGAGEGNGRHILKTESLWISSSQQQSITGQIKNNNFPSAA